MNWKMSLSWLALAAGGLWGKSLAENNAGFGSPLETALLFAYLLWSFYWGAPAAWRWLRSGFGSRILRAVNSRIPDSIIRMAATVSFFLTGGYLYCVLGGGIYQFVKHWRATQHRS